MELERGKLVFTFFYISALISFHEVLVWIEPVEPDFNNSSYPCINRFFVNPKVFCSLPFRSSSLCSTAESADGDEVSRSSRRIAEQL